MERNQQMARIARDNELTLEKVVAPGEGERRAQRGYGRQYAASAPLVFAGLMADELAWVGVADRNAGILDDLVLGLNGRVVGHQFKSSQLPQSFTIEGLLLGADDLLRKIAASWRLLYAEFKRDEIEIRLIAVNHYPRVCRQLSQMTLATRWTAARKFRAVLS